MNPSLTSVPSIRFEARIEPNLALPGRAWLSDRPRALIAIVHGLGEHSGRYAALAGDLVASGYSVAAVDWPGHGEAPGRRGDVRSWTWLRDLIVPAAFNAVDSPTSLPRVLLGHSMGGLMALDYALARPDSIAAVIASAPALRIDRPPWWKEGLARVARVLAPSSGFPSGIALEGISRDPEVVAARDADGLAHDVISPRLYFGLIDAQERVLRHAGELAIPALVMHGTADLLVHPDGSGAFCASAPAHLVRAIVYDGAYHEIFNDFGRDARVKDLLAWLDERV